MRSDDEDEIYEEKIEGGEDDQDMKDDLSNEF